MYDTVKRKLMLFMTKHICIVIIYYLSNYRYKPDNILRRYVLFKYLKVMLLC
jgi:hypothetical protein